MGFPDAGLPEVVKRGAAGGFPRKIALMKEVEVAPEGVSWFGSSFGECAKNSVMTGQPNGQQACLSLAAQMEQNSLILKWLVHVFDLNRGSPWIGIEG